jgi:hypothetical protein
MSKEREMIEKLCSFQMTYSDWLLLIADAEELLAQPEQESLTDEELEVWYSQHTWAMEKQEYMWGFRDAEKAYGIGVA